jgi:hypothetical protein
MSSTRARALTHLSLALTLAGVAPRVSGAQIDATPTLAALAAAGPPPEAVIELEPWRTRWTLRAEIGGATRRLLLDTGGGITLVSSTTAKAAGCVPWGRRTGYNMFGKRFDGPACGGIGASIGGRRYVPAITGLVNMAALNPADSALDGIASLDLFEGRAITLDLGHGRLIVESPASLRARVGTMRPLPIRLKREMDGLALAVMVGVQVRSGWLWLELDSGNGGTVLVSKPVAALVGLDSSVAGRQAADFPVADGVRVRTTDAFTPDLIMDGNLGMPFLRNWVLTLDLQSGTGWIAPAGASAVGSPPSTSAPRLSPSPAPRARSRIG